ncbi:MAG: ssDNA-binding domain-containing protein [Prevotellaceae bacterium]|jgi:antirestriction protein ArdC|nr:ssDNA-binding domain-containing protein [Prevotellaceae bacterium]
MATNNARNSKALEVFAELMIGKIQTVSKDWKKPWIAHAQGQPMNAITGRPYNGLNDLMLFFHTEKHGYKVPAYLTFKQATELGSYAKKGEKGFPIAYWGKYYYEKDDPEHHIKPEEYNKLSKEDKALYKERFVLQEYIVFNVQQTTIPEEKPDVWEKIQAKFDIPKLNDENGMFKSAGIDNMLKNKSWLCPVHVQESNRAFYRPMTDDITVPLKTQFKDGESFYSTLLHEMGHSTGTESRLNREHGLFFGDEKYAKEELVAELTAALSSANLGISTSIREENAQYLKSWLDALQQEPKFILTVLSDVHKASDMINKVVEQEVAKVMEAGEVSMTKGKELTGDNKSIVKTADSKPFTKDDIPKNELKLLGLKLSGLSATDMKNLLSGKETKTLFLKNQKGDRIYAALSLHRNTDNSVNILIKQVEQKQKNTLKI